ncbi:MAG: phosphatase PAP2 family protein [Terrimicrobiaceae bacterium]|nr:phosphatase PAP2 family protein [Terrimicrobiaceae bacterium]
MALFIALLASAMALSAAAFHFDEGVRTRVVAMQGKGWKKSADYRVNSALSRYGDWPELMALGLAGLALASLARSREWKRIFITAMIASTVAGILANSLRLTTGRTRPRESPKIAQAWVGPVHDGKLTVGNSKYNSFPSGHTATAIGFAAVLLFARPLPGLFALLAAIAIAWSRIALGAHHLSDVVVAAFLGLAVAWVCWRIARRHGDAIGEWVVAHFRRRP